MSVSNSDRVGASKRVGGQLNVAKTNSIITDTLVNANATLTLLKAAILTASPRPDDQPIAIKTNRALDLGKNIGVFSETHGQTTVAGLVGLTDAAAAFRQGVWS